jgi:hypothetical protein
MRNPDSSTQMKMTHSETRMNKKCLGSYYTPQHLAMLIANETLDGWVVKRGSIKKSELSCLSDIDQSRKQQLLNLLRNIRILDPAVGEGAFLIAAADWLNQVREILGDDLTLDERLTDIVKNSLFGVDLVDQAVNACKKNIVRWCKQESRAALLLTPDDVSKIKRGNSLLGSITIEDLEKLDLLETSSHIDAFHWVTEYRDIMQSSDPGFDIILGNPPYGNLLSREERMYIQRTAAFCVGGGRNGTWNSAAHFIARSRNLMKDGACLGFLVPNSILRVNQFSKTRKFLLDEICLWKIVDEGSPFEDVTLEMVSLFFEASKDCTFREIEIESRRHGFEQLNKIDADVLRSSRVFSIYHDSIFSEILKQGKRNLLTATRGRDIPKEHVSSIKSKIFKTPYITSGRSVGRYRINNQQQYYTNEWFRQDQRMRESFQNELLVATKNYRYPRCVMKPRGIIHGGGIVKITPLFENADLRAIGLILNSRLIKYICIRYLTNYSQLTTCLNTGIMESLPIVLPEHAEVFSMLFSSLSDLSSRPIDGSDSDSKPSFERLGDALVYELYFSENHTLQSLIAEKLLQGVSEKRHADTFFKILEDREVLSLVENIMKNPNVKEVEDRLAMK